MYICYFVPDLIPVIYFWAKLKKKIHTTIYDPLIEICPLKYDIKQIFPPLRAIKTQFFTQSFGTSPANTITSNLF